MSQYDWSVQVFFDGDCPLCLREINMLRRWDKKQSISFINIASPDFSEKKWGKTFPELMEKIHARLPNGTWIEGVEVFRKLYEAIGFKRLVQCSRWPVISHGLEIGYKMFARYRLRLTGRCSDGVCGVKKAS